MNVSVHDARQLATFVGSARRGEEVRDRLASAAYELISPIIADDLATFIDQEAATCAPHLTVEWNAEHRAWVNLSGHLSLHTVFQLACSTDLPDEPRAIWTRCAYDLHGLVMLTALWNSGSSLDWTTIHPDGHSGLHEPISDLDFSTLTDMIPLLALRGGLPHEAVNDLWVSDNGLSVGASSTGGGGCSRDTQAFPDALWIPIEQRLHQAVEEIACWLARELDTMNDRLEDGDWASQLGSPIIIGSDMQTVECSADGAWTSLQEAYDDAGRPRPRTPRQQAAMSRYAARTHRKLLRLQARHRTWAQTYQREWATREKHGALTPKPTNLGALIAWPGNDQVIPTGGPHAHL